MRRRHFLQSMAAAAAVAAWPGAWMAFARGAVRPSVLVCVFQRGAMDGLMAVQPRAEGDLPRLRPRLVLDPAHAPALGIDHRLHPALAPLRAWFDRRELAVVHGVGSPDPTRSHFEAQDFMETSTPGVKSTTSGWLARTVAALGGRPSPWRGLALTPARPRAFHGDTPTLSVADLAEFSLGDLPGAAVATRGFESLYARTTQELLHDTGHESFDALRTLDPARVRAYRASFDAAYPNTRLGLALRQMAMVVKEDVGLRVGFVESQGWDTHVGQGAERGAFARSADELARSLDAFRTDLGEHSDRVVVCTMTEFGRTVHENGNAGTDHGRASCFFVLGPRVHGGRVLGELPELARAELEAGRDLPVTTDFRAVFAALLRDHLGVSAVDTVLPGYGGGALPLFV